MNTTQNSKDLTDKMHPHCKDTAKTVRISHTNCTHTAATLEKEKNGKTNLLNEYDAEQ